MNASFVLHGDETEQALGPAVWNRFQHRGRVDPARGPRLALDPWPGEIVVPERIAREVERQIVRRQPGLELMKDGDSRAAEIAEAQENSLGHGLLDPVGRRD